MNTTIQSQVELSRQGNQEAFAGLVQEHQSLICSMTYAACGDRTQSEDLAQETFIQAWKNLHKLKDANAFKSWLCGIARNLIRKTFHQNKEHPQQTCYTEESMQEFPATEPGPAEEVSRLEDSAMVWRTLEQIPETYRVPMVLYYREEHSVARVAELLSLTEETARQRLSRGRALLKTEISKQVESTLFQTRPSKAFTLAVISALPAFAGTAAAAGIGASSAKGSAWLAGSSLSVFLNVLIGPLIGILGGWFGYRATMNAAKSKAEKVIVRKMTRWLLVLIVALFIPMLGMVYAGLHGLFSEKTLAICIISLSLGYGISLFVLVFYWNRKLANARKQSMATDPTLYSQDVEGYEYKSRRTFLGLPLIHVCRGAIINGTLKKSIARGWIAFGDVAYSPLLAIGAVAVGPIAMGAVAIGGIPMGGLALGGLALGGFGIGWLAAGGLTLGYEAIGGLAIAWKAAFGAVAFAREMAVGSMAIAKEANTPLAKAWFESQPLHQVIMDSLQHHQWIWFVVGFSPMLLIGMVNFIKKRHALANGTNVFRSGWIIECPKCHKAYPLAQAGGYRWKASSFEKRTLGFCRSCRWFRWMKIRFLEK